MCGIAGVLQFRGTLDSAAVMPRLDAALAHRGPDDRGHYVSPRGDLLLVHRRLSIIDPGTGARQPMASPDATQRLVFNGEVYNHRELRASLEAAGETFVTRSDTEVLLRLLQRDGPGALTTVRGMFALALWNEPTQTLTLARDRFGIKPLYLHVSAERLTFASEVRTLTQAGLVDATPDAAGVLAFLRWGHVPGPLSWLSGVETLAPGHWRRWRMNGECEQGAFARVSWSCTGTGDNAPLSDEALVTETRRALSDTVNAHLTADVPVGLFLSGGVDSTALATLARPLVRDLRTYTVGFPSAPGSEHHVAERVAAQLGSRHTTVMLDAPSLAGMVEGALAAMDQPTVDGVNTFAIARAVAATGCKCVLSGVGGDELFGGYPSFQRLPFALRWSRALPAAAPLAARAAERAASAWQRTRWQHLRRQHQQAGDFYRAQRGLFMPHELDFLAGSALQDHPDAAQRVAAAEAALLDDVADETSTATAARLESTVYLRGQLLRDSDALAMAHSLEVRVPFVDHRLYATLWPALASRSHLLRNKSLLTRAVPELPACVTQQPKRGFTLPFAQWLDTHLAPVIHHGLDALVRERWLASSAPALLLRQRHDNQLHWTRLWALAVLGHFVSTSAQAGSIAVRSR